MYDNEQQIQDQFAKFWAIVADYFSGNRYIFGYELLNEPWAGDIYGNPNNLKPSMLCYSVAVSYYPDITGVADPKHLEPMYKKLHSAIREHDDNHIILFEPTIIITSVSLFRTYY